MPEYISVQYHKNLHSSLPWRQHGDNIETTSDDPTHNYNLNMIPNDVVSNVNPLNLKRKGMIIASCVHGTNSK